MSNITTGRLTGMFTKKLVTQELVGDAHRLFKLIFPKETLYEEGSVESCFTQCLKPHNGLWHYWIWSLSTPDCPMGKYIGLSGIYEEEADPESAWLGWLGVLPEYRRERFGTRMLNAFQREARDVGYKYARIYTNEGNVAARGLYESAGYTMERLDYKAPDYVLSDGPVVIYSMSLDKEKWPLVQWGSRPLVF